MASRSRIPRLGTKAIPLTVQGVRLRTALPGSTFRFERWGSGRSKKRRSLIWEGLIQPSELSDSYKVRIIYSEATSPKVFVVDPKPSPPAGKKLPHIYSDGSLCLYDPKIDGPWNRSWAISDTILPWAAEWLLHYELWKVAGVWTGGGHEMTENSKTSTAA